MDRKAGRYEFSPTRRKLKWLLQTGSQIQSGRTRGGVLGQGKVDPEPRIDDLHPKWCTSVRHACAVPRSAPLARSARTSAIRATSRSAKVDLGARPSSLRPVRHSTTRWLSSQSKALSVPT